MRKILISSIIVFTSLLTGVLHSHAKNVQQFPQQRWNGPYLGLFLGFHDISTAGIFDAAELGVLPTLDQIGDEGLHGGLHAGHLWQSGRAVIGLEVDYSLGMFEESFDAVQDGSPSEAGLFSYPISGQVEQLATLKARAGLAFKGPRNSDMLIYASGGLAFAKFGMDIADGRSKVSFNDIGLVYGGGLEIALTDRLSLRGEVLRHDFDKRLEISHFDTSGVFDANDGNYVQLNHIDIVRVALSYKFPN